MCHQSVSRGGSTGATVQQNPLAWTPASVLEHPVTAHGTPKYRDRTSVSRSCTDPPFFCA